jgi:hypothetical protein
MDFLASLGVNGIIWSHMESYGVNGITWNHMESFGVNRVTWSQWSHIESMESRRITWSQSNLGIIKSAVSPLVLPLDTREEPSPTKPFLSSVQEKKVYTKSFEFHITP